MIKCIVTDLDGTLFLNHGKTVYDLSNKTKEALALLSKHNIKKYIASGRTLVDSFKVQKLLDESDETICTLNGTMIYDNGNKKIYGAFSNVDTKIMLDILDNMKLKAVSYSFVTLSSKRLFKSFVKEKESYYSDFYGKENVIFGFEHLIEYNDEIAKLLVYCFDEENALEIEKYLYASLGSRYIIARSMPTTIEINLSISNKGNMIDYLKQYKNYKLDEIAVFGDGENDLGMFKKAKYSYAMESGTSSVKEAAYKVVKDVYEGTIDLLSIK